MIRIDVCLEMNAGLRRETGKKSKPSPSSEKKTMESVLELCPGLTSSKPVSVLTETGYRIDDGEFILDRHPAAHNVYLLERGASSNAMYGFLGNSMPARPSVWFAICSSVW